MFKVKGQRRLRIKIRQRQRLFDWLKTTTTGRGEEESFLLSCSNPTFFFGFFSLPRDYESRPYQHSHFPLKFPYSDFSSGWLLKRVQMSIKEEQGGEESRLLSSSFWEMLALSKGVENGHVERLAERFSQVGVEDSSRSLEKDFKNDNLLLVIKAVEAAETTIKQQVWSLSLSFFLYLCLELVWFCGQVLTHSLALGPE